MNKQAEESLLATIGIPTHNRVGSLEASLLSAMRQDYRNLDIVVCDNASTDGTSELLARYARQDSRIRWVRHPQNIGPLANFKAALESARGEFFMWLADDDWIDHNYLSGCVGFLLNHPDYVLVSGRIHYYRKRAFFFEEEALDINQATAFDRVVRFYRGVGNNGVLYGVARRDQLLKIAFNNAMGWDWLYAAAAACLGKVRCIDGTRVHREYTWDENSFRRITLSFGLTAFEERRPYLAIALLAYDEIRSANPVYQSLSKNQRWLLALRVRRIVCRRHKVRWHHLLQAAINGEARRLPCRLFVPQASPGTR